MLSIPHWVRQGMIFSAWMVLPWVASADPTTTVTLSFPTTATPALAATSVNELRQQLSSQGLQPTGQYRPGQLTLTIPGIPLPTYYNIYLARELYDSCSGRWNHSPFLYSRPCGSIEEGRHVVNPFIISCAVPRLPGRCAVNTIRLVPSDPKNPSLGPQIEVTSVGISGIRHSATYRPCYVGAHAHNGHEWWEGLPGVAYEDTPHVYWINGFLNADGSLRMDGLHCNFPTSS